MTGIDIDDMPLTGDEVPGSELVVGEDVVYAAGDSDTGEAVLNGE